MSPVEYPQHLQHFLQGLRVDQIPWIQSLPGDDDAHMLFARFLGVAILLVAMLAARLINYGIYRLLKHSAAAGSALAALVKYEVITARGGPLSALVALVGLPLIFWHDPMFLHIAMAAAWIYFIWTLLLMGLRALHVVAALNRDHALPILSLVQAGQILLGILAFIAVISILLDKSPVLIFSGIGAMAAVLMLVFKDPLLGLVAGLQLSAQDMVRIGDWIELPDDSANGTVIYISITTVKVQNFDKTITCVPPVQLVTGPFINWRGMSDSGGRRIKRQINLDLPSIRFVDAPLRTEAAKIDLLRPFLATPEGQTADLTNSQLFRAYIKAYLSSRQDVHTDNPAFTFLVRHLEPTGTGLPIQIYVFTTTTNWAAYEGIQADIFDHLFAMLPCFGLMAYQEESDFTTPLPSGSIVRRPPVPPS